MTTKTQLRQNFENLAAHVLNGEHADDKDLRNQIMRLWRGVTYDPLENGRTITLSTLDADKEDAPTRRGRAPRARPADAPQQEADAQ